MATTGVNRMLPSNSEDPCQMVRQYGSQQRRQKTNTENTRQDAKSNSNSRHCYTWYWVSTRVSVCTGGWCPCLMNRMTAVGNNETLLDHLNPHTYTCTRTHVHTYVHVTLCTHAHTTECTQKICTYTHTHLHTHTHKEETQ